MLESRPFLSTAQVMGLRRTMTQTSAGPKEAGVVLPLPAAMTADVFARISDAAVGVQTIRLRHGQLAKPTVSASGARA